MAAKFLPEPAPYDTDHALGYAQWLMLSLELSPVDAIFRARINGEATEHTIAAIKTVALLQRIHWEALAHHRLKNSHPKD